MPLIEITIGLRVRVDVSGLEFSSPGATFKGGAAPGSAIVPGTVIDIDRVQQLITVQLDGSLGGHKVIVVPPNRIISAG